MDARSPSKAVPAAKEHVTLNVNGESYGLNVEPRETLLDVLRIELHLTGAKKGCDMGECGACTVLVDGKAAYACLLLAIECEGRSIFLKAMDRKVWSFALASVMVNLRVQNGMVKEANLVLGGIAPVPWLIPEAAAALRGQRLTGSSIARAAESGTAGMVPLAHNGYKVGLAKGLIIRALERMK